jgi:hypothetical protein
MRALMAVAGRWKDGPPYLMRREIRVERIKTLRMNAGLLSIGG